MRPEPRTDPSSLALLSLFSKVEGEGKGVAHEDDKTQLVSTIPLRRWEDWERSRLRRIKREERRQKDLERMERAFNGGDTSGFDENGPRFHPRTNGNLSPGRGPSEYGGSDSSSLFSSEDDQVRRRIFSSSNTLPRVCSRTDTNPSLLRSIVGRSDRRLRRRCPPIPSSTDSLQHLCPPPRRRSRRRRRPRCHARTRLRRLSTTLLSQPLRSRHYLRPIQPPLLLLPDHPLRSLKL
jgi:hypothetical protein